MDIDNERELEKMKIDILCIIVDKIDKSGFMGWRIRKMHEYGMPADNIMKFQKDEMEYLAQNRDKMFETEKHTPRINLDTDELRRMMNGEMNGD